MCPRNHSPIIALDRQRVRAQIRHPLHHYWLLEGVLSGFNLGGESLGDWQEWLFTIICYIAGLVLVVIQLWSLEFGLRLHLKYSKLPITPRYLELSTKSASSSLVSLISVDIGIMVKKGKHFSGKVTPLFASMLVQPTEDEGVPLERPSEAQPTPSPTHTSEVPVEPQTDPTLTHTSEVPVKPQTDLSPRPSPSTTIPDSIPESSGGNLGGHSSSDKSLSRNEGEMTLQSVYDLCLSLCAQVSDQAKEIQHLKAHIKKLKKQAKLVVKHHRAWMKSVSLKQKLARKSSSKKQWVHRESVSKQGRKFAKGCSRCREEKGSVDEEKENDEDVLSTKDVLSIAQQKVSTDKEKVSTDRPIVSTDGSKVSTDRQKDSTDEQTKGTDEQRKGTDDHTEEGSATQTTQPPTSTIFGDDETIAKVLLNMSQAKAVSREKEKGVE
ncbi:hypothetical protein Tco_1503343, partial [Tanacetum coccineum]